MLGKKSQFAIEFIILIAFMFALFLGILAIITSKILDAKESEREQIAEQIATLAKKEIDLAKSVANGYHRNFTLPLRVGGNTYTIEIVDNRELVVEYIDKEFSTTEFAINPGTVSGGREVGALILTDTGTIAQQVDDLIPLIQPEDTITFSLQTNSGSDAISTLGVIWQEDI